MRFQITIPEPCHESWSKMTPNEQGRHCASCDKTVVDFTRKTDPEIASFLLENPSACGRFLPHQLNRNLLLKPEPVKHYGFLKLAACAMISLGAFDAWSNGSSWAQETHNYPDNPTDSVVPKNLNNIQFKLSADEEKIAEISTITFKLGEFSLLFDYFQRDSLVRFVVPQSIDWHQIEIFIHHKSGELDSLSMEKPVWENILSGDENYLIIKVEDHGFFANPIADLVPEPDLIHTGASVKICESTLIVTMGMIIPDYPIWRYPIWVIPTKPQLFDAQTPLHPPFNYQYPEPEENQVIDPKQLSISAKKPVNHRDYKSPWASVYYFLLSIITVLGTIWAYSSNLKVQKEIDEVQD